MESKIEKIKSLLGFEQLDEGALADERVGIAIIDASRELAKRVSLDAPSATELIQALESFCWAHPISTEKKSITEQSRVMGMFYGPLFTSEQYPWPLQGERFFEPVVQFDLDNVGKLEGRNLGSGLLQLWMGSGYDEHVIRLIPIEHVCTSQLTPPPAIVTGEYFEEIVTSSDPDAWEGDLWRGPFCSGAWPLSDHADLITGTSKKILNWCTSIEHYRFGSDEVSDPSLRQDLENFLAIIPEACPGLSADHFFGRFDPIQYDAAGFDVLLACESGGWEIGGNWQIVMSPDSSGAMKFHFLFSCQ